MIYTQLKILSYILLITLPYLSHSQPVLDLKEKLERLLKHPAYDDYENEIVQRPRQIQGMLLRDLQEHNLFDSSSEERLYALLSQVEKEPEDNSRSHKEALSSSELEETTTSSTTTTLSPDLNRSPASTTSNLGQRSPSFRVGIERFGTIIGKLIDLWRRS